MTYKELQSGSAVLIALFVSMILIALLAIQTVSTRANLKVTQQRTASAQLTAQSVFSTAGAVKTAASHLSATASDNLTPIGIADGNDFGLLAREMQTWLPCNTTSTSIRLFIGTESSCGDTGQNLPVSKATFQNVTTIDAPLLLKVTAKLPDGTQRTRQVTGNLRTSVPSTPDQPLSITAMQVLTEQMTAQVPSNLIFDGPVHINATPSLATGRSEWPGGLSTASRQITIGEVTYSNRNFKPNPAFPCDQSSATCPNFGGGLSTEAFMLYANDPENTAGGLNLPGNIKEVVLFPADNATGVFVCTQSACDVYQVGQNHIWRVKSGTPVPGRSGAPVDTSPTESTMLAATRPIIIAPGDLEVRSLTPTGAAYAGTLTIISQQNLTIGSSLIAQRPVCTTYPVRNDRGGIQPATCSGTDNIDGLGLISERGGISIGQPDAPLTDGDTSLTLQASLLAPRGRVSIRDSRLETVDWIGSVAAAEFEPSAKMRLAHDPRALNFPGFPAMPNGFTPVRVNFDTDRGLD